MEHDRQDSGALAGRVRDSIRKAEGVVADLRKIHTRLTTTTIVSSAASTLVAGITAAAGPVVGEGPEGWRMACIIAAVLAFVSTVGTGIGQGQRIGDRLAEGSQCVGRLRYLDVTITTGSRSWEAIGQEYEEIAKLYPELIS